VTGEALTEDSPAISEADPAAASAPVETAAASDEPEREESIYEVMKQHMARQKEETEARNAASKQGGRPGPATQRPVQPAAAPPPVEKVSDFENLGALWFAVRQYLSHHARLLESVLGNCTHITALRLEPDAPGGEAVLQMPVAQRNFTNDKARAKLEEAIRAVTGKPLRLRVDFIEPDPNAPVPSGAYSSTGSPSALQRIPPELMDKVKQQPVIKELMKRLDATITQVEMLEEIANPTETP